MDVLTRLENRATQSGFVDHSEWEKAVNLHQICEKFGLKIPFPQFLIEFKGPTTENRQRLLDIIIREFEPLPFILEIDPLSVTLGSDMFLMDKALDTKAIQEEKLKLCHNIVKDLKKLGIILTMAEVIVLKGLVPDSLVHESTACRTPIPKLSVEERKHLVSLDSLCQRTRDRTLLPPILPIDQLSLTIIPQAVVEETIKLKQDIMGKWGLDLTVAQILAKRYLIDISLLHLLFLSQVRTLGKEAELSLGRTSVSRLNVFPKLLDQIQVGRDEARQFLAWGYRMAWLTFPKEVEDEIVLELEKRVENKKFTVCQSIQKELEKEGLSFSILKILALQGLGEKDLMEAVSLKALGDSSPIKKPTSTEGPAPYRQLIHTIEIEDADLCKILLRESMLKEDDLSALLLALENLRKSDNSVRLTDILIQKGIICQEKLQKLICDSAGIDEAEESEQEKRPSKLDMEFAKLITDYHVLPAPDLQQCFHLQTKLYQAGISKSLDSILIECRFLSPGMAQDLIEECRRRNRKKTETIEKKLVEAISQRENKPKVADIEKGLGQDKTLKEDKTSKKETVQIKRTAREKHSKLTKNREIFLWGGASVLFFFIALFSIIIFASALRTKKSGEEKNFLNKPQSTTSGNKTPQKYNVQEKVQPHQDIVGLEMEKKGYVKWGRGWVTHEEKKNLEKLWILTPEEKLRLQLDTDNVFARYNQYLKKIEVGGRFKISADTLPRSMIITFHLLGPLYSSTLYLEKHGNVKKEGSFEDVIGPLPKPLLPGKYGLKLSILPSHQDSLIQNLLKSVSVESWILPLQVGTKEDYEERLKKGCLTIENLISGLKKQTADFEKMRDTATVTWLSGWTTELQKNKDTLIKYREESLIPLFPQTEEGLISIINQMITCGEQMHLWISRRSLFPPTSISDETFPLWLFQIESDFKKEKTLLNQ